jgi:hypothetical protein
MGFIGDSTKTSLAVAIDALKTEGRVIVIAVTVAGRSRILS